MPCRRSVEVEEAGDDAPEAAINTREMLSLVRQLHDPSVLPGMYWCAAWYVTGMYWCAAWFVTGASVRVCVL